MKEYTVEGPTGPYSVQLSDEDAKARGLTPATPASPAAPKAKQPANKQASPANKAQAPKV